MHKADLHHPNPALQRKLEHIFQLRRTRSVVNWDQEKYLELLQHFGNPHKRLPPVVHVAGTNGKGSVIAMLRSICEAAGMVVHCYTSPHLMRVNERIVLAGQEIEDSVLEALIDEALDFVQDAPLSFFEIITAVAFKAFPDIPADILLLEVGMGGRLDCTNVIDAPLVSVINRISMDHVQFLGKTIEEIAAQKAGIIKSGVPCVSGYQGAGEQGRVVLDLLAKQAQQKKVPFVLAGQDLCGYSSLALKGDYQIRNAALVLAVIEEMKKQGVQIENDAISKGLETAYWPGRMQRIDEGWPGGVGAHEIWLDCGHNDSAGEVLAEQITLWKKQDSRPVYLVLGMLAMKDSKAFLEPLKEEIEGLYVVPVRADSESQNIEQIAFSGCTSMKACPHFKEAVDTIFEKAGCPVRVLIVGSVYLAGDVLLFVQKSESL